MAKAILEFDLDNPDDQKAFKRASKATDMAIALFEISHNVKHTAAATANFSDKEVDWDLIEMIFDLIHEQLENQNINIDELID